jgi:hypothetical protein
VKHLVELIPLMCIQCGSPIPAEPDEIAWVCATCGQGLQLDEEDGLSALEIHFANAISKSNDRWLPFWVAKGKVTITKRDTFKIVQRETVMSDGLPDPFWIFEQTFFVPAFDCALAQAVEWGMYLLRHPLDLVEGPLAEMGKVTLNQKDMHAIAELIVIGVEAERKDLLKKLDFQLDLEYPEIWVIPFVDKGGKLSLGIRR